MKIEEDNLLIHNANLKAAFRALHASLGTPEAEVERILEEARGGRVGFQQPGS